ncbi:MAG: sulfotransferase domain-containing protein [Patescibacteria group bacterium]
MHDKKPKDFEIDFIGIGTPKCGTEWLWACLKEHPEIGFSKHKEVNFFLSPSKGWTNIVYENKRIKSWEKYAQEFSHAKSKTKGEFSIHYIFDSKAQKKLKKAFPNIKVIVTIRDPVSFLHSMYWYMKYSNIYHLIPNSFEEALKTKIKDDFYHPSKPKWAKLIKQLYSLFGQENVHVILQDDIRDNPEKVVKGAFKFLGVDKNFKPKFLHQRVNPTRQIRSPVLMRLVYLVVNTAYKTGFSPVINRIINTSNPIKTIYKKIAHTNKKYPKMNKKLENKLREYYLEDIEELEKILKRDLSLWKTGKSF